MPSSLHESLLGLVREQPAFAADLLGRLLAVRVPRFIEAKLADTSLTEPVPVEYRADAVVVFSEEAPVFGAVIESQLSRDDQKLYSWPLYAVSARARHKCPFVLIVVALDDAVAHWAARPIQLGGGNIYQPFVIGPENIPVVTDREQALREPRLTILSLLAHGNGEVETAVAVGIAAAYALKVLPAEEQVLYLLVIDAALSEDARKRLRTQESD